MSRNPKFADHTKPRSIYGTPTFKYLAVAACTITGLLYVTSYCIYSVLVEKRVKEFNAKYTYVGPTSDAATNMVMEKVLALKYLKKMEAEAEKK